MKILLSSIIKKDIIEYFSKKGIEVVLTVPFLKSVPSSLLHPDIQAFFDAGIFYTSKNLSIYYKKHFKNIKICEEELGFPYPSDALFNCLKIENRIFCNTKYLSKKLLSKLTESYEIIHTNQGYTNCSSLYVGKNIVITSDNGMEKILKKYGYNVFFIDNSKIKLKNFKNGFIGGSAIKTNDEIVFFGKLEGEFLKIKSILEFNNIKYKDFSFPLEDFGSAVIVD